LPLIQARHSPMRFGRKHFPGDEGWNQLPA
jgi:hypothetical protein